MAFVIENPTNTVKIRDLGTTIRPNFEAIQTGDSSFQPQSINFTDRTAAEVAVDPTAIEDAYVMYCKTDAAGNSELFGINETSGIIQFTRGVPTIGTSGSIFLPGGVILKWGQFTMSGTVATITYVGGAYPTNTLMVSVCPMNTAGANSTYRVGSWTATTFNIHTASTTSAQFTYIAIGS